MGFGRPISHILRSGGVDRLAILTNLLRLEHQIVAWKLKCASLCRMWGFDVPPIVRGLDVPGLGCQYSKAPESVGEKSGVGNYVGHIPTCQNAKRPTNYRGIAKYAWISLLVILYTSRSPLCYDVSVRLSVSPSVCEWRKCIVITVYAGKRGGVILCYASHC